MEFRHAAITAALALLLATAGCLGAATTAAPTAGSDGQTNVISVSGTGTVEAAPDLAVVRVAVVATADDAESARAAVAVDAERMRAALRDAGVADDAVETAYYSLGQEYVRPDEERPAQFRAIHAYRIEVAPDRAGEIVDVAVGNGADRVDAVQFTLTDEARADLRAEAVGKAVDAARADADALADAAGVSVGDVRSLSTSPSVPGPYVAYAEGGASDARTTLEPGPVTVTASASVAYEIA